MDLLKEMWNAIPATWKPYVATLIVLIYAITKIRSMFKSTAITNLENENTELQAKLLGNSPLSKCISGRVLTKPQKAWNKIVDLLF